MTTSLANINDNNDFMAQLNANTGMGSQQPKPKNIKFNATDGVWYRETDEKDGDTGFYKWVEIGPNLLMHLVTTRKKYKAISSDERIYSREFNGKLITLYGPGNGIVFQGTAKELKDGPYAQLTKFVQVAYAYVDVDGVQVLHRVNLMGSNLVSFFPFLATFSATESISAVGIMAKAGRRMRGDGKGKSVEATEADINSYNTDLDARRKPKLNLYYELEFSRVGDIPRDLVIQRVTDVMAYLKALDGTKVTIADGIEGDVIDELPDRVDFEA